MAISLDSAASSTGDVEKSPWPQRVASIAALLAQSWSELVNMALFRCHGVICCKPPDVYLFEAPAALRISSFSYQGWGIAASGDYRWLPGSLISVWGSHVRFLLLYLLLVNVHLQAGAFRCPYVEGFFLWVSLAVICARIFFYCVCSSSISIFRQVPSVL